jgi:hypothetical protein
MRRSIANWMNWQDMWEPWLSMTTSRYSPSLLFVLRSLVEGFDGLDTQLVIGQAVVLHPFRSLPSSMVHQFD